MSRMSTASRCQSTGEYSLRDCPRRDRDRDHSRTRGGAPLRAVSRRSVAMMTPGRRRRDLRHLTPVTDLSSRTNRHPADGQTTKSLTLAELAEHTGEMPERLRDWFTLGLLKGSSPDELNADCTERVRLIQFAAQRGIDAQARNRAAKRACMASIKCLNDAGRCGHLTAGVARVARGTTVALAWPPRGSEAEDVARLAGAGGGRPGHGRRLGSRCPDRQR
jgi:hypothetical protein